MTKLSLKEYSDGAVDFMRRIEALIFAGRTDVLLERSEYFMAVERHHAVIGLMYVLDELDATEHAYLHRKPGEEWEARTHV